MDITDTSSTREHFEKYDARNNPFFQDSGTVVTVAQRSDARVNHSSQPTFEAMPFNHLPQSVGVGSGRFGLVQPDPLSHKKASAPSQPVHTSYASHSIDSSALKSTKGQENKQRDQQQRPNQELQERQREQQKFMLNQLLEENKNLNKLRHRYGAAEKKITRLEHQCQHCERTRKEIRDELLDLYRKFSIMQAKMETKTSHEKELQKELADAGKRALVTNEELNLTKRKVDSLQKQLIDTDKGKLLLQQELFTAETRCRDLELELERSRNNNDMSQKKELMLTEQNASTQGSLENQRIENESLKERLCNMEKRLIDTEKRLDEVLIDNANQQNQIREADEENLKVKEQLSSLREQCEEAKSLNNRYREQLEDKRKNVEDIIVSKRSSEVALKELQAELEWKRERSDYYEQQYEELKLLLKKGRNEMKGLYQRVGQSQNEMKEAKDEIKLLQHEKVEKMQNEKELNDTKLKLEEANRELLKLYMRCEKLQDEMGPMGNEVVTLQQPKRKNSRYQEVQRTHSHDEEVQHLEELLRGLQNQVDQLEEENYILKYEIQKHRSHEEDTERRLENLQQDNDMLQLEIQLMRRESTKWNKSNEELRQQLWQMRTEIASNANLDSTITGIIPGKYRRGNFEIVSIPEENGALQFKPTLSRTDSESSIPMVGKQTEKSLQSKRVRNLSDPDRYDSGAESAHSAGDVTKSTDQVKHFHHPPPLDKEKSVKFQSKRLRNLSDPDKYDSGAESVHSTGDVTKSTDKVRHSQHKLASDKEKSVKFPTAPDRKYTGGIRKISAWEHTSPRPQSLEIVPRRKISEPVRPSKERIRSISLRDENFNYINPKSDEVACLSGGIEGSASRQRSFSETTHIQQRMSDATVSSRGSSAKEEIISEVRHGVHGEGRTEDSTADTVTKQTVSREKSISSTPFSSSIPPSVKYWNEMLYEHKFKKEEKTNKIAESKTSHSAPYEDNKSYQNFNEIGTWISASDF